MKTKGITQTVAHYDPGDACKKAQQQCCDPTITDAQEEQQKICQVQLLFDRECPKRGVDGVSSMNVQVVQHERMKHNVPHIKPIELNRSFVSDVAEIKHERGKVRRVQATNSSFPERPEVD